MCGFATIVTNRPGFSIEEPLRRMLKALRHRGPDGAAAGEIPLSSGWRVGLAHARLAILDPSEAGLQPMGSSDGNLWIVFNGEIYNHQELRRELEFQRWRTGTDTETILETWSERGESAVDSLRGMFGMCVVDVRQSKVWVVRDRVGIKPVYFARVDDTLFLVASELRAILASGLAPRQLQREALSNYLAMGAVATPRTVVENVERLHPAEMRSIDLSGNQAKFCSRPYWTPPFPRAPVPEREVATRLDELKHKFETATASHLLSDVPVGVFLSGGIDSGAIVESISRQHSQVETFSVAFTEEEFDESSLARRTAAQFGTRHRTLMLSPAEMLRLIPAAFDAYDSPSYDGINTWFISRAVREAGVKVALSGIGGDELFAGYSYHRMMKRLEGAAFRTAVRLSTSGLGLVDRGNIRAVKLSLAAGARSRFDRYLALRRIGSPDLVSRLLPETPDFRPPQDVRERGEEAIRGLDSVNAFSCLDMSWYLQNTILGDADQMSMAHGLEVRVPLLDHEFVEAATRLPGNLKIQRLGGHRNKGLLLGLMERPLPRECTEGKKRGFVFPWDRWLRNELRDFAVDRLRNRRAIDAAGLDAAAVESVCTRFQARDRGLRSADVLCLLVLLNWVDREIVSSDGDIGPLPAMDYAHDLRRSQRRTGVVV